MKYSGVFVFGDSLVDSGNVLKLGEFVDDLPLMKLPTGVPSSGRGYYDGRFTNGFNFADLISNKFISVPTSDVFPYHYSDPYLGLSFPFTSDPKGNNLNFAYGGARIRQGDEVVPDLDDQTDAFRDAVDGKADPTALHLFTIGGNDVRGLVPRDGTVTDAATARAILVNRAEELHEEVMNVIQTGARHILVTGIADVGIVPEYNGLADEAARRAAATEYSAMLDGMIQQHLAELRTRYPLVTVHYVSLDKTADEIVGKLGQIFSPEALASVRNPSDILFFDKVHPTAQAHALLAASIIDSMSGSPAGEAYALKAPDYRLDGTISAAGEIDSVLVSLAANTIYTFEMLGISSGSGSLADPKLRIIGPGGTVVGGNDDGGLGLDASFRFSTGQAGDYVVELSSVGSLSGAYRFQLNQEISSIAPLAFVGDQRDNLFIGELGDDQASGNAGNDTLIGGGGNDRLFGGEGNDRLEGGAGNDQLDGGAGADRLEGGLGDDIYTLENAADQAVELAGQGTDTVKSAISHTLGLEVENLTLTGTAALSGTGNVLNNVITGNMGDNLLRGEAGNDWLDGKAGADVMHGGAGNDSYTVDNVADQAVEESAPGMDAGGSDTVNAAVSYRLGGFVEHLTLVGTLNIEGTGNALANTITGNSAANALRGEGGNDRLIGGLGSDTMYGGEGNDSYAVDNAGDVASERLSTGGDAGGIDSVASSVSFTVDDFIENLTLTGTAAIDGTGNGLANQLTGNGAANTLRGGGGNDVLSGGSGDDWLYGDAGLDQLTGGLGADRFVLGGPSGASKDRVADFNAAQGDKLVFSGAEYGLVAGALDASRFSVTGVATSSAGTGQFVYSAATKSLLWDADGSGAGAAVGIATLNIAVAATDLLIL